MVNKREKARLGLALCRRRQGEECKRCPYREPEWDGAWEEEDGRSCWDELMEDALELLAAGGEELPARLLDHAEIQAAPELSVLYEEVRVDWGEDAEDHDARVETAIAPMEKRGGLLIGAGLLQEIKMDMFEDGEDVRLRFWSGRPTEEQRANTPWEGIADE